jgi:hypothetical protein
MKKWKKTSKNHYAKKNVFLNQKTHRSVYGNKTALFQKKHQFTM